VTAAVEVLMCLHKPGCDPAAPAQSAGRGEEFPAGDYDRKDDPANAAHLRAKRGFKSALERRFENSSHCVWSSQRLAAICRRLS
jgi:hypothetical protein